MILKKILSTFYEVLINTRELLTIKHFRMTYHKLNLNNKNCYRFQRDESNSFLCIKQVQRLSLSLFHERTSLY